MTLKIYVYNYEKYIIETLQIIYVCSICKVLNLVSNPCISIWKFKECLTIASMSSLSTLIKAQTMLPIATNCRQDLFK